MPTYDYHCDACGHEFEEFQYIKEAPLKKCPTCKKMKLRRLIGGGAAIVFKGSGFYQTDYRSESYKKGAADAKSASPGSKSTESEAKTKPTESGTKPNETKPSGTKTKSDSGTKSTTS